MPRTLPTPALTLLAAALALPAGPAFALEVTPEVRPEVAALMADPTDETVGDAASFGRNVVWLGLTSGSIELDLDCSPATPTDPPRTSCIVLNPAPALTTFDRPDLDVITLPGRSSKSLLCHWQTPVAQVFWQNSSATNANARVSIRPYYRFESEVLADPTLINPLTGAPFAGGFEQSLTAISESGTMAPGSTQNRFYTFTRTCIGGAISRNFLVQTLGLSEAQATQFFRKPITIRAGLRGNAQLVQFATINVGTRFLGD